MGPHERRETFDHDGIGTHNLRILITVAQLAGLQG